MQFYEKLMIQSWENLVTDGRRDGRTGGQTDRKTDKGDFMWRFPTNVERPNLYVIWLIKMFFHSTNKGLLNEFHSQ